MIGQVQRLSLWDKNVVAEVLAGARLAPGTAEFEEVTSQLSSSPTKEHCSIGLPMFAPSRPGPASEARCSACRVSLASREEQVDHYRHPWHLSNLRRATLGQSPFTLLQFEAGHNDSSSSGSEEETSTTNDEDDDEEEEEEEEGVRQVLGRQARVFFLNADGQVLSLYRNVLFNKRVEMDGEQDAIQRLQAAPRRPRWAVILLSGGHFAAAIFRGHEVEIHKTFHNYTVRTGQGGSQSQKDNQSGTSHPRSSGASLRRYNEQSQCQHIQDLLESWRQQLTSCDLIFCHTKNRNRAALFGGRRPVLDPRDDRIRNVPISTRRPKFAEVRRIHTTLSEVLVHGTEEEFEQMVRAVQEESCKAQKPKVPKAPSPKKSPKKPKSERKKRGSDEEEKEEEENEEEEEEEGEIELVMSFATFSTEDLGGGPGCTWRRREKRKERGKKCNEGGKMANEKGKMGKTEEEKNKEQERTANEYLEHTVKKDNKRGGGRKKKKGKTNTDCSYKSRVWNALHSACTTGDLERLQLVLGRASGEDTPGGASLSTELLKSIALVGIPEELTQVKFGKRDQTMLHVAAESGQVDTVRWLLDQGCDPGEGDAGGKTAYQDASDKETRNTFRRFMSNHPQRYQYDKAKIPSPLTQAEEEDQATRQAARRKAQRQSKLSRQKKKRKEEREEEEWQTKAQKEEEEKKRFLLLSDREKRALAAERRLQSGANTSTRCFQCGRDISLDPFHYSDFKFCSTTCVREHRSRGKS